MKIQIRNPKSEIRKNGQGQMEFSSFVIRQPRRSRAKAGHSSFEDGMVTVIFIALLAIMMVLVMVESSSLLRLRREVQLLEHQQIKRLNSPQTNTVSTVTRP